MCWRDRKNYNNLIKVQRIICQWFECASAVFSDYLEHLIIQAIRRVFVFEYCAVQSYFYKLRQCQPTFSTQLVITLIITSNIFAYKNQKKIKNIDLRCRRFFNVWFLQHPKSKGNEDSGVIMFKFVTFVWISRDKKQQTIGQCHSIYMADGLFTDL